MKNEENSQPIRRERQAGNQKIEKTVNQEGEKGKLEIKKLRKQSTKRARMASWKSKNEKTVNQEENEVNYVWLWHAVRENMREFTRSDLTKSKKSAKP